MRTFLRYWLPVLAYCGGIFALSSVPGGKAAFTLFFGADKLIHAVEFGLLASLVARALGPGTRGMLTRSEAFVGTVLFCLAFGALDEVHQSYVPGRYSDFWDLAADLCGASLGAGLYTRRLMRPAPSHAEMAGA